MGAATPPPRAVTNPVAVALVLRANRLAYGIARGWLWTINGILFLVAVLPFVSPLARAANLSVLANGVYAADGWCYHQRDDRSFHIAGERLAGCHRCSAIYPGTLLAGVAYVRLRHRLFDSDRRWWALLVLPMLVDALIQATGAHESTAVVRATTGALSGIAAIGLGFPLLERGFADIRGRLETRFARLVTGGRACPPRGAPPVSR